MDWLMEHVKWVFSGIGVVGLTVLGGLLFNKKKEKSSQSIQSGHSSKIIQSGRDVNISLGEKKHVE